jgi:hypothetical protein
MKLAVPTPRLATAVHEYTANRWVKIGLALVVLGWGPLLAIIALTALHLWPDPNPNPIGPGLLFFFTFWPAVGCLAVGAVQVARGRKGTSSDALMQSASRASPQPDQADWISNPAVRAAAAIVGLVLIVKGGAGLRHGGGRGAAAAIVLGAGALYWAVVGRLPLWLRR